MSYLKLPQNYSGMFFLTSTPAREKLRRSRVSETFKWFHMNSLETVNCFLSFLGSPGSEGAVPSISSDKLKHQTELLCLLMGAKRDAFVKTSVLK